MSNERFSLSATLSKAATKIGSALSTSGHALKTAFEYGTGRAMLRPYEDTLNLESDPSYRYNTIIERAQAALLPAAPLAFVAHHVQSPALYAATATLSLGALWCKSLLAKSDLRHELITQVLAHAALKGDTHIVEGMLEHGADIHAGDDLALRNAAANGHVAAVKLLLDHGARHAHDALVAAELNDQPEAVALLKQHIKQQNDRQPPTKSSPPGPSF